MDIVCDLDSRDHTTYRHGYHLNEVLAQYRNAEPRIPPRHLLIIREICLELAGGPRRLRRRITNRTRPPRLLIQRATDRLGQYIRQHYNVPELDERLDGHYHKKYAERWLQIWCFLLGDRDSTEAVTKLGFLIPSRDIQRALQCRCDAFEHTFEQLKHTGALPGPPRRNIPYLHSLLTQMLIQEVGYDWDYLRSLVWYFRQLRTAECRVNNELRIWQVIGCLRRARAGNVRWRYYPLFYQSDLPCVRRLYHKYGLKEVLCFDAFDSTLFTARG